MRIRIITLRYSSSLGGFDTTPVDDFLRDKELASFREHFFSIQDVPHLTCVLSVVEAPVPVDAVGSVTRRLSEDPRNAPVAAPSSIGAWPPREDESFHRLDGAQRKLYANIRAWRAEQGRRQGVPAFVVLTNRQLTDLVVHRPGSLTALGNVPGIGPSKVERYGPALLELLGVARTVDSKAGVPADAGELGLSSPGPTNMQVPAAVAGEVVVADSSVGGIA